MTDILDALPQAAVPRCIFLASRINFDAMVHAPLIARLRERHGTRLVVWVGDRSRARDWQRWIADGDRIVVASEERAAALAADPDPETAYARARANEERYGITYLRNVLHQDKGIAARYLQHVPNSAFAHRDPGPLIDLVRETNHYIALTERAIERDGVDLLMMRLSGVFNSAAHAVARSRSIPSTFVDHVRQGKLLSLAEGPDHGSRLVQLVAAQLPAPQLLSLADIAPPPDTQWFLDRKQQYWSLGALSHKLYRLARNYAVHWVLDLAARRRGDRLPFTGQAINLIEEYRAARMLDRMSLKSIPEIADRPFVLFTLHFDPEYTSSTLARDFNHTHAIIQQLALSLPSGYRLVLKEHVQGIGSRDASFYRSLSHLPNLVIADHRIRAIELAARAEAVATVAGTIASETSLLGRPVIVFSPYLPYTYLPNMHVVRHVADLPRIVRDALKQRSAAEIDAAREAGARYRVAAATLAFEAPALEYDDSGNKNRDRLDVAIPSAALDRAERLLLALIAAQRQEPDAGR